MELLEWDARVYDSLPLPHTRWGAGVIERLALHGDETVLEIGCGTGRDAATLLDTFDDVRYIGADGSRRMLDEAASRLAPYSGRVQLMKVDLREPFTLDDKADAAYSVATLHWMADHSVIFRNVANALRTTGRFVAEAGGAGNIAAFRSALTKAGGKTGDEFWNFADVDTTAVLLDAAGFADVDVRLVPYPVLLERGEQLEAYIATVMLGAHLREMAPAERRPLVHAVAAAMPEPVIDYVRLQIHAVRR